MRVGRIVKNSVVSDGFSSVLGSDSSTVAFNQVIALYQIRPSTIGTMEIFY